jgi:hypothetical protein
MGTREGGEEDGLANDQSSSQDRVLTRHAARRTIGFKTLVGNRDTSDDDLGRGPRPDGDGWPNAAVC